MQLAVNYSAAAAELVAGGQIRFDCFKCPAWPDLVTTAQPLLPVYVHFPLLVGAGRGDAMDGETGRPADWAKVAALLACTATPQVNVHLSASPADHPGVPLDTDDPSHVAAVAETLATDLRAVVARFGAERVIAENDQPSLGECLRPAYRSEVITRVIRDAGCGLLLDLAHARLAADSLGMDPRDYVAALPVERVREIHVTGVQRVEGHWIARMQQHRVPAATIERLAGRRFDHLPMTEPDWALFAWAMEQIRADQWAHPRIVTFEYGGVSPLWESMTDADALREQVPRLYRMVAG